MLDMEEGAFDRAVVGFETVMGEDSTYANGLFFTARCYEAMGNTEAALIRYNEYLSLCARHGRGQPRTGLHHTIRIRHTC